jgi:hypothetical protein
MRLNDVIKIIWFSLFFSIAIGGIFRETEYYYQTPKQYYSDSNQKEEITQDRYDKGIRGSYDMFYTRSNTFDESLAIRSFFLLIILGSLAFFIMKFRR